MTDHTTDVTNEEVAPVRTMPADPLLAQIAASVPGAEFSDDGSVVTVDKADLVDLATAAKAHGFEMFIDLCGVDYLRRTPRFEVVINLLSISMSRRLRIRVGVDGPDPSLPTISDVYPGSNFYEREAYDMFGIDFAGHPDLTRILMPDEWEGYPLRKDYGVGSVPVQFKDAHKAR